MTQDILERMKQSPVVFDGAMGTMIYSKGVFLNVCYDELCLSNPGLIQEIHREYVAAGADVIETNSFGANRIKLRQFGLAENVEAINRAAVRLAREAAGEQAWVAGSIGPCLKTGQMLKGENKPEIVAAFREQMSALAGAGASLLLLETFCDLNELRLAAQTAREFALPVFASFTVNDAGETALGAQAESVVAALNDAASVDAIGLNCGAGPAGVYEVLERVLPLTQKPFLAMPNAGVPREVEGRMLYLANPEYFTEYAKRFIELGVRAVGGCCGTTPAHIRVMARAVKSLSGARRRVEAAARASREEARVAAVPTAAKSRLANLISRGRRVTSVELLPPKSSDLAPFLAKARACHLRGIDAINIPDGPRASARVSPMVAAIAVKNEIGIEPVLHYCCRDRNLIGMQSDLLGGFAAGLRNFLIITGDPPKLGEYPDATGVFDVDAIGLTRVVHNLNHGCDVGGATIDPPTAIFIGVGANPTAIEPRREMDRFMAKIDAGAEFAITQPVFDADALFRFMDQAAAAGRCLPIVAGVWPLTSYKNAEFMRNEVPGVSVPAAVMDRMSRCQTKEDGLKAGVEIARAICERIAPRVAGFQISAPFGRVELAIETVEGL